MNDTHMTIVGNVVDEPKLRHTKTGVPVASFRIASSSRRYDKESERWIDSERLFVTVTCWRALAQNVGTSLHKGQPVIAVGRIFCREYEKDESVRMSYELDADAVGHDLARGTSVYARVARPFAVTSVPVSDDGIPADMTHLRIDAVDPDEDEPYDGVPESPEAPALQPIG
jgi:single-strand DNA-binding protein